MCVWTIEEVGGDRTRLHESECVSMCNGGGGGGGGEVGIGERSCVRLLVFWVCLEK